MMASDYDELFSGGDNVDLAGGLDFPPAVDLSNIDLNLLDANSPVGSGLFDAAGNINLENIGALTTDPELFQAFQAAFPEDAVLLKDLMGGDYGFAPVGADNPPTTGVEGAGFPGEGIKSGVKQWDDAATKAGVELTDTSGTKSLIDKVKGGIKDLTGLDAGDAAKYAALLAAAKLAYEDAQKAREEARGWSAPGGYSKKTVTGAGGVTGFKKAAMGGGIGSLEMARGGRALPPRYLNGHSDGMEDKVPAHIDGKRPAALSDGEFVIPADVVSHLGNGNSNAGAKRLYKMMDRIRAARTGNPKQGKQINPDKFMPR
jgi:hypothetical protein